MTSLLLYTAGAIILLALSLLVIFSFLRYRFKGDKTLHFIALFALLFIGTIIATLSLVVSVNPTAQ
jgi:ABC-type glycerol-3-phosphate transport system permease component